MSGYDSAFHLAEECSNAAIASPRAIFLTSAVGGTFGWFLQLVVAYTVVDISQALDSDLGQPFAAYLIQCVPQRVALAILSLTIIAGFFMGQGCMIAASRVTFAYARDDCFPFSNLWKRVNAHTRTPVNAVWLNNAIGCIILLLIFGGELAIGAIFSIGACAAFVAFTTPIFIRVFFVGNRFRPGPWNLGRFSMPIGMTASGFVALMVPILCLPSVTGSDLNVTTMNWTCLVYGGPMVSAAQSGYIICFTDNPCRQRFLLGGSFPHTNGSRARKSTSTISCATIQASSRGKMLPAIAMLAARLQASIRMAIRKHRLRALGEDRLWDILMRDC